MKEFGIILEKVDEPIIDADFSMNEESKIDKKLQIDITKDENTDLKSDSKKEHQKKEKEIRPINYIHAEPFVLHSIKISKKDIMRYIRNKSVPTLGDDYYYAYTYVNNILTFISIKSKEHAKGSLSRFAHAILNKGSFYYSPEKSKKIYFLENRNGLIKLEVGTAEDIKSEHRNLMSLQTDDLKKCPKTLYFQWSLQRQASVALGSSLVVFVISLIMSFGITLQQNNYHDTISRSMRAVGEIKKTYEKISPMDVVAITKNLVAKTKGSGYIRYVKYDKNSKDNSQQQKLSYELVFSQLTLAEQFAKENGVKNELTSVKVETSDVRIK